MLVPLVETERESIYFEPVSEFVLDVFKDNEKLLPIERALKVFEMYPTHAREKALAKLKEVKICGSRPKCSSKV